MKWLVTLGAAVVGDPRVVAALRALAMAVVAALVAHLSGASPAVAAVVAAALERFAS